MKAVTKIITPLLLGLAGVVLAAPHQSATTCILTKTISCSAGCIAMPMSCCQPRNCMAKVESSVLPVHESSSFLYW